MTDIFSFASVVSSLITALAALIGAAVPLLWLRSKTLAETKKTMAEAKKIEAETELARKDVDKRLAQIEQQVTNSHGTNLRNDLDENTAFTREVMANQADLRKGIEQLTSRLGHELGEIRRDITQDRAAVNARLKTIEDHLINEKRG